MIVVHILANVMFLFFAWNNIVSLVSKKLMRYMENRGRFVLIGSISLGFITYITYIVMLAMYFRVDGFDKQSFSLLILGWAFMYAANVIQHKQLLKIKN